MTASPENPIIKTLMKSFNLNDPLSYSSEYSRDYIYASLSYFKFLQLRSLAEYMNSVSDIAPINLSLLNEYTLFYFL